MKKWLIVLLTGVVIFGLGISISIFEFSEYRIVTPPKEGLYADTVTTLMLPVSANGEITIETFYNNTPVEVITDNQLSGQMRVEVTGPGELYQYRLRHLDGNHYYLSYDVDPFKVLSVLLEGAKNNEIYNIDSYYDDATLIVSLNEKDIERFKPYYESQLYQERQTAEERYNHFEEQMEDLREQHQEELDNLRENYEEQQENLQTQLETQRQNYEEQLETQRQNYEERLEEQQENYEEQLENLRNQ